MANEFRTLPSHSAEYFGETRDFWWNADFLDLMGRRLAFDRVLDVLDVGCGVGHWGQLLAAVLPAHARVQGVDRDPEWVEKAADRAAVRGLGERFNYQVAVAEKLPFADASFDLVTCQTLLIHTPDPGAVIDEMVRVARPGGLILAVEPNNVAGSLMFDSLDFHRPVDDLIALVRFQLICERGKAALREGNNSIGDLVPGLFAERKLVDIRIYQNDKTNAILPPYETREALTMLEERADLILRDFLIWSRDDTHRYFIAGGGGEKEFDALWSVAATAAQDFDRAVRERCYFAINGSVTYLIAGRKPRALTTQFASWDSNT